MLGMIFLMAILPMVSADTFGTFKTDESIELTQLCVNDTGICDGCNITSIRLPNGSAILSNVEMTSRAADFNYTILSAYTHQGGLYKVDGFCYGGGLYKAWSYDFNVNAAGYATPASFFWIILVFAFGLVVFGLWKEDYTITTLGTFA